MNLLQEFLERANTQSRGIVQEAFTITGDSTIRYGTFGDPEIRSVMMRQGYQDHLITPLKVQASQFASSAVADAAIRSTILRTSTSRTFFVQAVDYTAVVVYTFILTDRQL